MEKTQAVESLGQRGLLLPAWVKAALAANDRLKLYLTVLQTATEWARHGGREIPDLGREMTVAGMTETWLRALPANASALGHHYHLPDLPRLVHALAEDLSIMARPVVDGLPADQEPAPRLRHWLDWLATLQGEELNPDQLEALTHGKRGKQDSLHLLVMDLHKAINHLAGELASEVIDGAHAWQLTDWDRLRVRAFMAGLNRTAPLKFDHPGLDTAATRDGERLLIQNDIGTNDAHVLVIQVWERSIALTYSDLHRPRFEFFQRLLAPIGAQWSGVESRVTAGLNEGSAYVVGTATFLCDDEAALDAALSLLAARIVFLIDWNRARKRLQLFVGKAEAVAILEEAARHEVGHRGWLQAGGEALIFGAMQAAGEGAFRIGDRLDEVLGPADAHAFLLAVMRLACEALGRGQPPALVADETRMLLARQARRRTREFDLLTEHAAYCHTLAQAVSDALAHGHEEDRNEARKLAARAKAWERRADHLVMQARDLAERLPRWRPFARLLEQADDVADALEEGAYLISLAADHHHRGWTSEVRKALAHLAATVLEATQDQVKALAIARTLGAESELADNDAFLAANWRVLRAERDCDELLREARRVILSDVKDAAALTLANDLAGTLEQASDSLLAAAYALRDVAFQAAGAGR
ncbi:MAG: phosphate transport regulator [Rhodocyclaceae bacterium]|nr:phosphate transport regulator [Rhodocyclaceae bacterium]